MKFTFDDELRGLITRNVGSLERREISDPELRSASVTLVIAEADNDAGACLLLTRRSAKLRRHAGQFALPGGRVDEGESFECAALRELHEELGLDYGPNSIIGVLDDYRTESGFCIRPFVVWGGSLEQMKPDPIEVAIVYQIPLHDLNSPSIPQLSPGQEPDRPVLSAPIAATNTTIHSPTASLIYQFREVAMNRRHTRVAHFGQPRFAWK